MKKSDNARHFPYKHPTFGTKNQRKAKSAWESTVYYWWWSYLRRNAGYLETCASGGRGEFAAIYRDFGDVRGDDFKSWWTEDGRGVRLFAEPRAEDSVRLLEAGEIALGRDEALTVSLPLYLPRKAIEARMKHLLDMHHTGPPRHNTCRFHRTKNPGAAMKDRSWHDTDKHSRTGRLLGCCRLKARRWSW